MKLPDRTRHWREAAELHMLSTMRILIVIAGVLMIGTGLARAGEPALVGIERTTQHMVASVLAADIAGYLEVVSRADPFFWKEQHNWAADLREHTPERFDLRLESAAMVIQRDGSVTVPMTTSWKMRDAIRESSVTFPARFVREGSDWRYAGEAWTRIESSGVEVLVDPELVTAGLHIAHVMPRVRAVVDAIMNMEIDVHPQVKLYRTMGHLQQSIYLSYTDPLGGWNEPGEAMKILYSEAQSGHALRTLLAHEYGHVATFAMGKHATDMPWWVLEGVAEWCAAAFGHSTASMERRVQRWAARNSLREWSQLADFRGEAMNHMSHVYSQGHHMIQFIVDRFSRETMLMWLRAMAEGASIDDATRLVLGMSFEELDFEWREQFAREPAVAE